MMVERVAAVSWSTTHHHQVVGCLVITACSAGKDIGSLACTPFVAPKTREWWQLTRSTCYMISVVEA